MFCFIAFKLNLSLFLCALCGILLASIVLVVVIFFCFTSINANFIKCQLFFVLQLRTCKQFVLNNQMRCNVISLLRKKNKISTNLSRNKNTPTHQKCASWCFFFTIKSQLNNKNCSKIQIPFSIHFIACHLQRAKNYAITCEKLEFFNKMLYTSGYFCMWIPAVVVGFFCAQLIEFLDFSLFLVFFFSRGRNFCFNLKFNFNSCW